MSDQSEKVRIIGGDWRGRKIQFPDLPDLRPTQDRVRETLFNWLDFTIDDAHCLDLFAGSGVLGFEALSRGAHHVTFVDKHREVIRFLQDNRELLNAENCSIIHAECPHKMPALQQKSIDIVFVDPPFEQDLVEPTLVWLEHSACLKPGAFIYVEMEKDAEKPVLPPHWKIYREKQTSTLSYLLYRLTE